MANNTLTTRILLCSGSTTEWASSSKVILKGEVALEFTTDTTQPPKVKIGDGAHICSITICCINSERD